MKKIIQKIISLSIAAMSIFSLLPWQGIQISHIGTEAFAQAEEGKRMKIKKGLGSGVFEENGNGQYEFYLKPKDTLCIEIDCETAGAYQLKAEEVKGDLSFTIGNEKEQLSSGCFMMLEAGVNTVTITSEAGGEARGVSLQACGTVYEAERARLGGYAKIAEDTSASGGAKAVKIGGPKTDIGNAVFSVYAPKDGNYGVIIDYEEQGNFPFYVAAGGITRELIHGKNERPELSFLKEGRKYTELPLKEGMNQIKVYSDKGYTLDLDCIKVAAPARERENTLEENQAVLHGTAGFRTIYKAENGRGITGLGVDGSADFYFEGGGDWRMNIWYSSPEFRGLEVFVDDVYYTSLYCPITGEDYNIETITCDLRLSYGRHKITFKNRYADAPDIDKVNFERTIVTNEVYQSRGTGIFSNGTAEIRYDLSTGRYDFYSNGVRRAREIESVVKVEKEEINTAVKSSDYHYRRIEQESLEDGYGKGTLYRVVSYAVGKPTMKQSFSVYDGLAYILVQVELEDPNGVSSNFMAPVAAMGDGVVDIGEEPNDARSLFVPFDNDNWARFSGEKLEGQHYSHWVTALYDNTSRAAFVTGSVDHDTFKSGTSSYGGGNQINFIGAFGGIWNKKYTYDYVPHGSIDGTVISSPRFFIGYFDDWRDGMEEYARANANNIAPMKWDGGVPMGYNSWSGQGEKLNFADSMAASDFIYSLRDSGFTGNGGVAYINLDSYWDNMSDEQLRQFVEKCKANGQKAGIYWSHFVFWATETWWDMGLAGYDYTYRDAVLEEPNGGVAAIAKNDNSVPLDPTSDAMKARLKQFMEKITDMGFEFLKIDFLNYAALEGEFRDPEIKTGMQCYHQAVKMFSDYVDTDKFFISYSIAPIFPYQYAHARRISCDAHSDIGETEYMLNSLNYGWWQDDNLYCFTDPDHLSLKASGYEGKTRYNAGVIAGTMMLLSDNYNDQGMKDFTREIVSNREVLEIAKIGKAFRPVEGNVEEWTNHLFTLQTDDAFYLAVFNFDRVKNEIYQIDLERIGLRPDKNYVARDLWNKTEQIVNGRFTVELTAEDSTIFKITPAK